MSADQTLLRQIPKVDKLLELALKADDLKIVPRVYLLDAVRQALDDLREDILSGAIEALPGEAELLAEVSRAAADRSVFSLRPVINATGVVLHTNLGRAVMSPETAARVAQVACSYSTLEYDPAQGRRGSRHSHVENLLTRLTGAEAAMAVNNNAAAVLLMLTALFKGRELIVSRGELVEIGGAFRVPDIMEEGGAVLREVGTTNRTRLSDYARAIDPEKSGGLLKVHTSNFRIIGYTEECPLAELASLTREKGLPLIYDLGSGTLLNLQGAGLPGEPTVQQLLAEGADLVSFSGDKLLGASQAGLIVGRQDLVARLKKHPLARAVRVDKLTLAALEATLREYLDPEKAKRTIPTLAMLFAQADDLKKRAGNLARFLASALPDLTFKVLETFSQAGGGAAPERELPSWAVSAEKKGLSPDELEERLRRHEPPVVARIWRDLLIFDVRTVREDDFAVIGSALNQA